ncbi:MAG: hypothetical protein K0R27_338 [Xanthobacteraceae bacterium]|jgi:hypothetical protein|nr:hypothetical protein [Xanthobacteraceae bacterium]
MEPYVITTRRITVLGGQLAEIPPDAPPGLRTWTCHAFFVPGGKASQLKPRIKQTHIDITEVDGGAWVYGGHFWLEQTLKDLGLA